MTPKPVKKAVGKTPKSEAAIAAEVKPFPPAKAVEAPKAAAAVAPAPVSAALVLALRDPSAEVALEAAAALGRIGHAGSVPSLIEAVANRDGFFHCVVRAAAATSLGQLRDVRAVEPLVTALRDPMAEASQEAAFALGELADARAVSPLLAVVENADGFFLGTVRRTAVRSLTRLRDARALKTLTAVAANVNEDPAVREAAAEGVRALGQPATR